ncbi:putative bifunctional diguanylate cyclase/phosphodiesterase [Methylopila musalis]|uniref:Bifunctional diguanylate cyclase/phosphodiesterase n=1 Tax=Methylopila musalis TaxID=1134781 RepID=A0ABW3Z7B7_9HYPH
MTNATAQFLKMFGRKAVAPLIGMLIAAFVLSYATLNGIADRTDREAEAQSLVLARAAWDARWNAQDRLLTDYADWGDAYENLHLRQNRAWAYDESNLGPTLFSRFDFGFVFAVGPDGRVVHGMVDGVASNLSLEQALGPDAMALVERARAAPPNTTKAERALLTDGRHPVMATAAALSTGGDRMVRPTAGAPTVLIFGERLTPATLKTLGESLLVADLRVARDAADAAEKPSFTAGEAPGAVITLRWTPNRPGTTMIEELTPWLIVAALALILLIVVTLRYAARAAVQAQTSADRLVEAYQDAERKAFHDTITDLPNRAMLTRRLTADLVTGRPLAVLYLDLDRFKPVNDALGHPVGDRVLRETAARLTRAVREGDLVARIGGDEFAVVVPRIDAGDVEALCRRLQDAVNAPIEIDDTILYVGLSIGIALAPEDATTPDELLRLSDIALYQAKAAGRGTFKFFSTDMDERILTRRALDADMRRGLDRDEFFLLYQPRYEADTMRLRGVEALVRWRHPQRGLVNPGEFIPLAEETGLIAPLGARVLRMACEKAVTWPDLSVSVNVSPAQFRSADFVKTVSDTLAATGLSPKRLELELTEGVLLEDVERSGRILADLKALGVMLSMDDFGTGYSSLGYLKSFPFDAIKIDQRFIADLQATGDARAIVQAILGLGRALGLSVTAEGVETAEQLALLRQDACEEVQGYLMARPLAAEEIDKMRGEQGSRHSAA